MNVNLPRILISFERALVSAATAVVPLVALILAFFFPRIDWFSLIPFGVLIFFVIIQATRTNYYNYSRLRPLINPEPRYQKKVLIVMAVIVSIWSANKGAEFSTEWPKLLLVLFAGVIIYHFWTGKSSS